MPDLGVDGVETAVLYVHKRTVGSGRRLRDAFEDELVVAKVVDNGGLGGGVGGGLASR